MLHAQTQRQESRSRHRLLQAHRARLNVASAGLIVRDQVAVRGFVEKDADIKVQVAEYVSQPGVHSYHRVAATSADATSAVGDHPMADGACHHV